MKKRGLGEWCKRVKHIMFHNFEFTNFLLEKYLTEKAHTHFLQLFLDFYVVSGSSHSKIEFKGWFVQCSAAFAIVRGVSAENLVPILPSSIRNGNALLPKYNFSFLSFFFVLFFPQISGRYLWARCTDICVGKLIERVLAPAWRSLSTQT